MAVSLDPSIYGLRGLIDAIQPRYPSNCHSEARAGDAFSEAACYPSVVLKLGLVDLQDRVCWYELLGLNLLDTNFIDAISPDWIGAQIGNNDCERDNFLS